MVETTTIFVLVSLCVLAPFGLTTQYESCFSGMSNLLGKELNKRLTRFSVIGFIFNPTVSGGDVSTELTIKTL